MRKFRHEPMKTDMIRYVMATMDDSDNKRTLLELIRFLSSILLCMHISPLSPEMAAQNCVRNILFHQRHMTAKNRHTLQTILNSPKGATSVVTALLRAVNKIEADYVAKVNAGLFCAA